MPLEEEKSVQPPISKLKRLFRLLGPGLITGASDDDPSGIATYSQAGASYGLATLWTALLTFPLMAAIQSMCARIGLVTQTGLTSTLKNHYPRPILYMMLLFSFPAITLNIGADIQGMGAVSNLLLPFIPDYIFSILFTLLILVFIIRFSYRTLSNILKWLCLPMFVYLIVPFLIHTDWLEVVKHTFIPTLKADKEFLMLLVGILGTTISPYLFFWQATMEAEDMTHDPDKIVVNKQILDDMKTDVNLGMFFSNLVMYFVILTTGIVLFNAGIHKVDTVDEAAKALEPLAGKFAYVLFAFGVIGTGFLAIPVLAGSLSYIMSETFDWRGGLDKKFYEAKQFYITIAISLLVGLSLNFIGISPIKALLYTAVLYGLTAPVLIAVILHICNNKKVMQGFTNSVLQNILGWITLILMSFAAVALIYFQFRGWVNAFPNNA